MKLPGRPRYFRLMIGHRDSDSDLGGASRYQSALDFDVLVCQSKMADLSAEATVLKEDGNVRMGAILLALSGTYSDGARFSGGLPKPKVPPRHGDVQ